MRKTLLLNMLALLATNLFAQTQNENSSQVKMDSIRTFHLERLRSGILF
jgi:hypothetical protein